MVENAACGMWYDAARPSAASCHDILCMSRNATPCLERCVSYECLRQQKEENKSSGEEGHVGRFQSNKNRGRRAVSSGLQSKGCGRRNVCFVETGTAASGARGLSAGGPLGQGGGAPAPGGAQSLRTGIRVADVWQGVGVADSSNAVAKMCLGHRHGEECPGSAFDWPCSGHTNRVVSWARARSSSCLMRAALRTESTRDGSEVSAQVVSPPISSWSFSNDAEGSLNMITPVSQGNEVPQVSITRIRRLRLQTLDLFTLVSSA